MKIIIRSQTKTFALTCLTAFVIMRYIPTETFVTETASIIDMAHQPEQTQMILGLLQSITFITTLPISAVFEIYLFTCFASLFIPEKTKNLQEVAKNYLDLKEMSKTFNRLLIGAIIANAAPYLIKAVSEYHNASYPALADFINQGIIIMTFALIISIISQQTLYRAYSVSRSLLKIYMTARKI